MSVFRTLALALFTTKGLHRCLQHVANRLLAKPVLVSSDTSELTSMNYKVYVAHVTAGFVRIGARETFRLWNVLIRLWPWYRGSYCNSCSICYLQYCSSEVRGRTSSHLKFFKIMKWDSALDWLRWHVALYTNVCYGYFRHFLSWFALPMWCLIYLVLSPHFICFFKCHVSLVFAWIATFICQYLSYFVSFTVVSVCTCFL